MLSIVTASCAFSYQPVRPSAHSQLLVHETFSAADEGSSILAKAASKSCGVGGGCTNAAECKCACPFKKAPASVHSRSRLARMTITAPVTADATREAAEAVVAATAAEAEKFTVKGGNGGDLFGNEGIQPVIAAAIAAAAASPEVAAAVEEAGVAAAARTNANAGRVADAIIVAACLDFGVARPARRHPITDVALYGSLYVFTSAPFKPLGLLREK